MRGVEREGVVTGEAVGLEIVGVHVPVTLVDVVGVTEARVARRGVGAVVAHVVLVDIGTFHVVCVHVAKIVEVSVDLGACPLAVSPSCVCVHGKARLQSDTRHWQGRNKTPASCWKCS